MAITKVMHMKASDKAKIDIHLEHAINYILRPQKLGEANLAGGLNCLPDTAYEQMRATKKMFGKTGGRQGYHFVISLKPGEGTPQLMYDIAMQYAQGLFGEYETVVAVHTDKEHLHAHIVINSVNMVTGYKFQYNNGDWKYKYQPFTNKLCKEYGLDIMPAEYSEDSKNVSRPQWELEKTFRELIKEHVTFCIEQAEDMRHFIYLLGSLGYEVKEGAHIAVKAEGMKRFRRLDTLDENFSVEKLEEAIKCTNGVSDYAIYNRKSGEKPIIQNPKFTSSLQRKYYARVYRRYKAKSQPFKYHSAALQRQIQIMHQLQDEYLALVKYEVTDFIELTEIIGELRKKENQLSERQKQLYRERYSEKRNCKTDFQLRMYMAGEASYRESLEQIKEEKAQIRHDIKALNRCFWKEINDKHPELEKMLEQAVDNGEGEKNYWYFSNDSDIGEKWQVPENPYKVDEIKLESEEVQPQYEAWIEMEDSLPASESELETEEYPPASESEIETEKNPSIYEDKFEIESEPEFVMPDNKYDYEKMSYYEKAEMFYRRMNEGNKTIDEIIMDYLKGIHYSSNFDECMDEVIKVREEYQQSQTEMFINAQVTDTIYRLQKDGMSLETTMSMPLLEQVKWLNFEQMEYGIGIKVYRQLLEKACIDKDVNEIYENYDKIYDACMKKPERKNKAIR